MAQFQSNTTGLVLMLSLLIASALSLPAGSIDHSIQTREASENNCYNQNTDVLPQARAHSKNALDEITDVNSVLDSFFKERLSTCASTLVEDREVDHPHKAVLYTYTSEPFDAENQFTEFITAHDYTKNCSSIQSEINTTISYVECSTSYMGLILQNLTRSLIKRGGYTNSTSLTRQSVYSAYKNVSWIVELKKLATVFPCAQEPPNGVSACSPAYDQIDVQMYDTFNTCVNDLLSGEGEEYKKQVVVLAQIAELFLRLSSKLVAFTNHCLPSSDAV